MRTIKKLTIRLAILAVSVTGMQDATGDLRIGFYRGGQWTYDDDESNYHRHGNPKAVRVFSDGAAAVSISGESVTVLGIEVFEDGDGKLGAVYMSSAVLHNLFILEIFGDWDNDNLVVRLPNHAPNVAYFEIWGGSGRTVLLPDEFGFDSDIFRVNGVPYEHLIIKTSLSGPETIQVGLDRNDFYWFVYGGTCIFRPREN